MADDQRVYSDEEFARILRSAAELANRPDQPGISSTGLTLAEMKSAASQAGLDPALIERAARMVASPGSASPFARLIGGPLRHEQVARFSAQLDEEGARRLLSAVRIAATDFHSSNDGHSSALGMTWKASGEGDVLSVVARPDENGTSVSIGIDRRGTFALTCVVAGLVMAFAFIAGVGFYREIPALAPWIPVAGLGVTLAAGRSFWASSTRKARERIGMLMNAIAETLD